MRIFVAGATGALGNRLVPMLVSRGHEVVGTTRHATKADEVRALGAEPAVLDALDRDRVLTAVADAKPDVVVHELTALSGSPNYRKFDAYFATTNRLRTEGLDNLLAAARSIGARRFVAQSFTGWPNERSGGPVKTEADPLDPDPTPATRETLAAVRHVDSTMASARDIEGVSLRYGAFYGPGNALGKGGIVLEMIRKRQLPVVGGGTGVWSFVHIDDAAEATVKAIEGAGTLGLYNIVDDEPAPVREWLPYLAQTIGAKPPLRLPAWVARLMIGAAGVAAMTSVRGSSNAKARRELAWAPRYATWRDGFRTGLG
ncbi:MAG TPA: NAD(P)-dependent oxidoreductase [Micromonosporaceae bacterium]|jgi:nucleoside-diphosphate-sugar epimerase